VPWIFFLPVQKSEALAQPSETAMNDNVFHDLDTLFHKLVHAPFRTFEEAVADWQSQKGENRSSSCIYSLYTGKTRESVVFVGETDNLAQRLREWNTLNGAAEKKWRYVQSLSDAALTNARFRRLFESYCIFLLDPIENGRYLPPAFDRRSRGA
jgi:hypothetical protein